MYKNNKTQFPNGHNGTSHYIIKINHQLHKISKSYPSNIKVLLH